MVRIERYVLYSLPIISLGIELVRSFLGPDTKIMAVRDHGVFLIIMYLLLRYIRQVVQFNLPLVLMMIYFFVTLVIQGFELAQYNFFIRVFDAKMLLPLGFVFASSYDHIRELNKRFLVMNILFVSSIIIFSILGVGNDQYGSESGFKTGNLMHSRIYVGSFLLLILPVIYSDFKSKFAQNASLILGVATLIILILSVRRTAVAIVVIGAIVYIYYYRNHFSKIFLNGFLLFVLMFSTFPLYQDILIKQMSARSTVFNDRAVTENLEGEIRYAETIAVINERLLNPDLRVVLFGEHLFDSAGNYAGGIYKDRPLHLDTNVILHGAGVVGLLLLISFYGTLYASYYSLRIRIQQSEFRNLIATFLGMYLSHLFILLSGGMSSVTFNMITSLYMGSILGYFTSVVISRSRRVTQIERSAENTSSTPVISPFIFPSSSKGS